MKVLVVDDDAMQRMVLADLVRGFEKVEIVEAADGMAAWTAIGEGLSPVLCCCDMLMPEMSGIELLQRFKSDAATAHVPFVFITAATDRETIKEAIAAGATNYILKPINLVKARSCLEEVFHGIRSRYSEEPLATQRRMGIPAPRLLDYFATFAQEIAGARPSVRRQLAGGEHAAARAKLDTLRTGCISLGLRHAATMIEHLRVLEPGRVDRSLADVEAMAGEQMLRVRSEFGLPEARRPRPAENAARSP